MGFLVLIFNRLEICCLHHGFPCPHSLGISVRYIGTHLARKSDTRCNRALPGGDVRCQDEDIATCGSTSVRTLGGWWGGGRGQCCNVSVYTIVTSSGPFRYFTTVSSLLALSGRFHQKVFAIRQWLLLLANVILERP